MGIEIPGGYAGKILRINLSSNIIHEELLNPAFCRRYLGGTGFISCYLYKELKPKTDPLNPENKLIFALGPVTGMPMIGSGRSSVGRKSELVWGLTTIIPQRFFEPKTNRPLDDKALNPEIMEKAKRYYYTLMGWDKDSGIPLPEKIEELGILEPLYNCAVD